MLFRMYALGGKARLRWEIMEESEGEEAGIKSATIL
jgi:protein subunit release factor B